MKSGWLRSKTMSAVFTGSAWAVAGWLIFMVLDWPPPLKEIEKTAGGKPMMAVLFLAVFAVGVLGLLVIIVGMAISCVLLDRSSVGAKVLWFLVFFFTAPVGSMVYFFTVYKKIVATQRETVDG